MELDSGIAVKTPPEMAEVLLSLTLVSSLSTIGVLS